MNVYLGANAKAQAICFALCFSIGLASGVFALLFLRKANPVERALTDFFACALIGGAFAVAAEIVMKGKISLYGTVAFLAGTAVIPLLFRRLRASIAKRRQKREEQRKNAENQGRKTDSFVE